MFVVAIIGRPNVGKSTLFNRLSVGAKAIAGETSGITRDRREGEASLAGLRFNLIDTAGLEEADEASLEGRMRLQTEEAIGSADLVLFMYDVRAGITEADRYFANLARKSGKAVVVLGNKAEGKAGADGIAEGHALGFGDVIGLSAEHGEGLSDLYDALLKAAEEQGKASLLTSDDEEAESDKVLRVAFMGRPNMGKSTLVNRLLGEERLLIGSEAGITHDSIEVPFEHKGRALALVDTAGVRRRSRISEAVEKAIVNDAMRSVRFAHVCVLLVDSRVGLHRQDLALGRHVVEEGRGLVIGANMWDGVSGADRAGVLSELRLRLDKSLGQVRGVPIVSLSGLTGEGVEGLLDEVFEVYERWNMRIETGVLNRWLGEMLEAHPPPLVSGRRLRLRYMTQVNTRPPSFALFASRPSSLPKDYIRYLSGGLRDVFGLEGIPLRLMLRKGKNPYAE